jgi:hypothetical protein
MVIIKKEMGNRISHERATLTVKKEILHYSLYKISIVIKVCKRSIPRHKIATHYLITQFLTRVTVQ